MRPTSPNATEIVRRGISYDRLPAQNYTCHLVSQPTAHVSFGPPSLPRHIMNRIACMDKRYVLYRRVRTYANRRRPWHSELWAEMQYK
jgi:hypothetical protein